MSWRVEFRPEVEEDVAEAAAGYEARQPGLGAAFVEELILVWDACGEPRSEFPAPSEKGYTLALS